MSRKNLRVPQELQVWIVARQRHRLSHAHVQMARELGMNPKKLGKLDNHDQEPWKAPLPVFIEQIYEKRFGRSRPERILCIEDLARERRHKQEDRKRNKQENRKRRQRDGIPESKATPLNESSRPDSPQSGAIG